MGHQTPVRLGEEARQTRAEPSAAFTPGPWLVYGEDPIIIIRADGCSLGEMSAGAPDVSHSEQIANTRLAAAAPDLLAALQEALAFIDGVEGAGYGGMAVHMCAQMSARDAIAKALGPAAQDTSDGQVSPGRDQ